MPSTDVTGLDATALPRGTRRRVAAYFAGVTLVVGFTDPTGLIWLPVQFTLKDEFGFSPEALAIFEGFVLLPASIAFVWGWIRDRWRPRRLGDRAFLIGGCAIAVATYGVLARPLRPEYVPLALGLLLASALFELISASAEAMMTTVSQRYLMTGRISAVDHFAQLVAEVSSLVAGGWLVTHASLRSTFALAAASTAAILPLAIWCPASVRGGLAASDAARPGTGEGAALAWRSPTIWLVVAILALWSFQPCWGTPLLYYLTTSAALSPEAFGVFRAVNYAAMAASAIVYASVCKRQPLGRILMWTVPVNLAAALPILLMTGAWQAYALGAVSGFLSGFGNIALFDLSRRACPPEFAGAGTMLAFSGWTFSSTVGDVLGSWLYGHAGIAACIAGDMATKALILPLLTLLPPAIKQHTDGQ